MTGKAHKNSFASLMFLREKTLLSSPDPINTTHIPPKCGWLWTVHRKDSPTTELLKQEKDITRPNTGTVLAWAPHSVIPSWHDLVASSSQTSGTGLQIGRAIPLTNEATVWQCHTCKVKTNSYVADCSITSLHPLRCLEHTYQTRQHGGEQARGSCPVNLQHRFHAPWSHRYGECPQSLPQGRGASN